jgi:hypothetical protein
MLWRLRMIGFLNFQGIMKRYLFTLLKWEEQIYHPMFQFMNLGAVDYFKELKTYHCT